MIPAARDAIETKYRNDRKCRVIQRTDRPCVASELAAGAVVGISAKDPDAGRVDLPIVSDDIPDNVVGDGAGDFVLRIVQALREMRRAQQSGVKREDERRLESFRIAFRESASELHDCCCPRPVVVGTGRIRSSIPSVDVADA